MRFLILFFLSFNAIAGIGGNQIIKQADFIEGLKSDKNFVKNASFEDTTYDSSWTITSGTQSLISSTPFGSNAIRFTGSVANGNIQSLTGSGTAQAGLNCLVSAFVKTVSSNVQVCAIHNGTLDTNLCVNVNPNNTWAQYQIPTVCDAVSTVARIRITTSVATTFDVDNVYVGVNPNFGSVAQARLLGTVSITNCSTNWSTTSTTFANFAAQTGCTYTVTGSALAPSTNVPGIRFASLSAGEYKIEYSGYATMSGANPTSYGLRFSDGTNSTRDYTQFLGWGSDGVGFSSQTISYSTQQGDTTIQLQGRTANGGIAAYGTTTYPAVIRVYYYPPSSSIVTTNNQDYDWTAYTPTITGFGTATNIAFYHKRQGSDLLIRGRFTEGTTTATEARVSLPSGLTSSSAITTLEIVGDAVVSTADTPSYHILIEPSVTYTTFGRQVTSTYAGLSKRNGNQMTSGGATYSYFARVPIQGWNNNNVIVGTFAGVGNIKGLNNSVNEVMFGFGTTTQYTRCTASPCTIFENGSAFNISVTRSTTGLYQIVFPSDFSPTVKPKCWLTGKESSVSRAGYCGYQSTNPTSTTINLECRDGTGNINDVYMDVFCKGY